jgi:hypothetical protein
MPNDDAQIVGLTSPTYTTRIPYNRYDRGPAENIPAIGIPIVSDPLDP